MPAKKKSRKKTAKKRPIAKKKIISRTKTLGKKKSKKRGQARGAGRRAASARAGSPPKDWSGAQAGDLQGLSRRAAADSESVEELLEEGNAFEAGVVEGVEGAKDEREVRTREVPEDDVPDEYLDQDK